MIIFGPSASKNDQIKQYKKVKSLLVFPCSQLKNVDHVMRDQTCSRPLRTIRSLPSVSSGNLSNLAACQEFT